MNRYSDMILEVANMSRIGEKINRRSFSDRGVSCHTFEVDSAMSRECLRGEGKYYSFEKGDCEQMSSVIAKALKREIKGATSKVLMVGLGNPYLVADKLGSATLDRVRLADNVAKLYPLCGSLTNIRSVDILKSVISTQRPSCVLIIDTLATSKAHRLGSSYQLTTAGMTPGGGVGNAQELINTRTLGALTLALGVPLILNTREFERGNVLLTLASVDEYIVKCSEILANGINLALD